MYITEEELDYYSNPISTYTVNEANISYKPQMSFEEIIKRHNCITIDEFSEKIGEAIMRLVPNS